MTITALAALLQTVVAALIVSAAYAARRVLFGPVPGGLRAYCGWHPPAREGWVPAAWTAIVLLLLPFPVEYLGTLGLYGEFWALTHGEHSLAWRIARHGLSLDSIVQALLLSFVQTGLAEEILFRGLLAKRLIARLGFGAGNALQAALFAAVHNALVAAAVPGASGRLHAVVFASPFLFGLLGGYLNEKRGGGSIVPSWLVHGAGNFGNALAMMLLG